MKARVVIALTVLGVLVMASCSAKGSGRTVAGGRDKKCAAQIGIEGPFTGKVAARGQQQLHFAELALAIDNKANKTHVKLVKGDTELSPARAMTVTQQLTLDSSIVAVVGPAGSGEVEAVGSLMARAGMPFVSGSATAVALTSGEYPTFFRVVATDSVQGSQDASYIVGHLHPKALMIVADEQAQETGLIAGMLPIFTKAKVKVDQVSVPTKVTRFASLAAKVTRAMTVVVLPWQVASNAQRFGRDLTARHKKAVIFGTDGLFSPGKFTIAGSYVSSFGPDIAAIPADAKIAAEAKAKYGLSGTFGAPVFAATHVIDEAIASVCEAGRTPSRANVMAAIRKTNEPTSILGQPIRFDARGDLVNARSFLFKIDSAGAYQLVLDSSP